jgi:hypothetical protein
MRTKEYSVYNETRENFLSSRVTVIDTKSDPLQLIKVLIEGLAPNADTGLWLNPLKTVPTVPRLSPYDLVYLDQDCRVVHGVELVPTDEFPRFDGQAASALVLPIHTFSTSQAHPGDQVIIRAAEEVEHLSAPIPDVATPAPAPLSTYVESKPTSVDITLDPPMFGAYSIEPHASIQKLEAREEVQCSEYKSEGSKIRFWRWIVHLRVHISISITPVAAVQTTGSQSEKWTAQRAPLRTRCTAWSETFLQRRVRPSIATVRELASATTRSLARKRNSWKLQYLRWAEGFVYSSARVPTRVTARSVQGAGFQALNKDSGQAFLKTWLLP